MATDSSQAGYLRSGAAPPYGKELEDIFHDVIVGITGIVPRNVRPQYQEDPPSMPGFDVDWCSFRVFIEPTVWNAYKALQADGSYVVEGTEVIRVTACFYGPNYQSLERSWRDGMQLAMNRDALLDAKIGFIEFADPVVVPALLKQQWVKRADVRGTFHRWASRTYPVLSFRSADIDIDNETFHTLVTVTPPSP